MLFRVFSSSIILAGLLDYTTAAVSIVGQTDLQNLQTPYTNVTCHSDYNWVVAYLLTACAANTTGGNLIFQAGLIWHVTTIDTSLGCYPYGGPRLLTSHVDFVESPCACSSVIYELLSACGACQAWNNYTTHCVDFSPSLGSIPITIPPETAVPSWAFQDPTLNNDYFNPTLSKHIGDFPENTPPSGSLASGPNSPPPSTCGKGANTSKVGAIAGGVVGGIVGIAAVALVGWLVVTKLAVAGATGSAGAGSGGSSGTQVPLIGDPTGGSGATGGHAAGFGANGTPFLPDSGAGAGAGFGSGVAGAGAAPGFVAGGAGAAPGLGPLSGSVAGGVAGAGAGGTGASIGAGVAGGGGGPGLLPYLALPGRAGRRRESREDQYPSEPALPGVPEMSTYGGTALITEAGPFSGVPGRSDNFNAPPSADSSREEGHPGGMPLL
ncbi:hypothetical protein BS47DRAFT_1338790 [Hydnum rufescens UP504]|uniref:Uncharacterized protein n=1 Tax=Hydnum rufescens UP504 TaxID=1448309 RepID=A0A9P6E156_9AGAM|nr:hypothetical protein BS47DRAFT_1338790 [Hydnum rufescens UP504]